MNPILRNILAVAAGIIVGSIINLSLVSLGHSIIAPPLGVDPMDPESMANNIDAFTAKHFIFPFLAHALGTLAGAFLAAKIAATRHKTMALIIGFYFLLGGIMVNYMISPPMWIAILDIVVAYLPMAWLGWRFANKG